MSWGNIPAFISAGFILHNQALTALGVMKSPPPYLSIYQFKVKILTTGRQDNIMLFFFKSKVLFDDLASNENLKHFIFSSHRHSLVNFKTR